MKREKGRDEVRWQESLFGVLWTLAYAAAIVIVGVVIALTVSFLFGR